MLSLVIECLVNKRINSLQDKIIELKERGQNLDLSSWDFFELKDLTERGNMEFTR